MEETEKKVETRGRKKKNIATKAIEVQIQANYLTDMDMLLKDPVFGKLKYGARSQFINEAVAEKLNSHRKRGTATQHQIKLFSYNGLPVYAVSSMNPEEILMIKDKAQALLEKTYPLNKINIKSQDCVLYLFSTKDE